MQEVNSASSLCNDPRIDGFVSWGVKQDLYRIKWSVEQALRSCPKFAPEEEWLREQEKLEVLRILKDGTP